MAVYEATATREGRWWTIRVHGVENAVTQARHVREIDEMAAGVVQALLDLDEPPEVRVTLELPDGIAADWEVAGALQRQADADEQRAATLRRQVVRRLLDDGWSQIDASTALGLSYQRVQQLARSERSVDPQSSPG